MTMMTLGRAAVVLAGAAMTVAGAVGPAFAAPTPDAPKEIKAGAYSTSVTALGGPNGKGCDFTVRTSNVWGWCDGTGPERYRIYVKCSNGRWYPSASAPWWGDRRGATAYCPSGTRVTAFKGDWA
ncbi:hypothetical protein [Actinomadura flavalba]|uniref:hypothetical protein n=1 Tax=Actinomadura flavalba TaxID=1120938 RepID=UPI00037790E3|nr:hypothetical protein [Actinomadura flavalba]